MADEVYWGANPFSGLQSKVHVDDVDGKIHIEHLGDNEPIIERNKAIYNGHSGWSCDRTGESKDTGFRHVAALSPVMIVALKNKGIDIFDTSPENTKRLLAILNSSDYRLLRTTPGRI